MKSAKEEVRDLLDPAWQDLENAADYIARDSEFYTAAFVREVKEASSSLNEFADRGQIVPEFGDESIRELLIRSYRLIYRVSPKEVVILAFIHSAMRHRHLLLVQQPQRFQLSRRATMGSTFVARRAGR